MLGGHDLYGGWRLWGGWLRPWRQIGNLLNQRVSVRTWPGRGRENIILSCTWYNTVSKSQNNTSKSVCEVQASSRKPNMWFAINRKNGTLLVIKFNQSKEEISRKNKHSTDQCSNSSYDVFNNGIRRYFGVGGLGVATESIHSCGRLCPPQI